LSKNKKKTETEFLNFIMYYFLAPLTAIGMGIALISVLPIADKLALYTLMFGFLFFLWGIKVVSNDLARTFLIKKGKLYAAVITTNRKLLFKPAKKVSDFTIKVGNKHYYVRPQDFFIGPKKTVWAVVTEGAGVFSPMALLFSKEKDIEKAVLNPNLQFPLKDERGEIKGYVSLFMNPDFEDLKRFLEKEGEKGNKYVLIEGFSIPLDQLSDLTLIDQKVKAMAEELMFQNELIKGERFKELLKYVMLLIPMSFAALILFAGIKYFTGG